MSILHISKSVSKIIKIYQTCAGSEMYSVKSNISDVGKQFHIFDTQPPVQSLARTDYSKNSLELYTEQPPSSGLSDSPCSSLDVE